MITKNTVFILGAGASRPYGFPSGEQLVKEICQKITGNIPKRLRSQYTSSLTQFEETIKSTSESDYYVMADFKKALSHSGCTSIDAFLEHRLEFRKIGKMAIAGVLIKCENQANLFKGLNFQDETDINGDWYKYLFNRLKTPSFDDFSSNKFSVVTFNYDRSLEHYLFTCLKYTYGKSNEEVYKKLKAVNIVHLHGLLGNYSPDENSPVNDRPARTYNNLFGTNEIEIAGSGIKIISEPIENDPQFNLAHQLLDEADYVCFLGFGYNEINLKRLKLDKLSNKRRVFVGSTYGLTYGEIRHIWRQIDTMLISGKNALSAIFLDESVKHKKDLHLIKYGKSDINCLDSLRNNAFLNDDIYF